MIERVKIDSNSNCLSYQPIDIVLRIAELHFTVDHALLKIDL